jgi:hypothetical protein
MSRFGRPLVVVTSLGAALLVVVLVGLAWKGRAEDICEEKAPQSAGGYSLTWEWAEFSYACDYHAPRAQTRRVGVIDAFHGDGRRRHGG